MRIGILTTHLSEEEERLQEVGKEMGHEIVPLEVLKFGINICSTDPRIYYEGKCIRNEFDAIIPRVDPPHTAFGFSILRQFQAQDVYTTDTAHALGLCRYKMRCSQYMMRKNIPFPTTAFAYSREEFDTIIESVGGTPVVIKLNEGTEGVGVFLADTDKQAKNFLMTFKRMNTRIMLQEFIGEANGEDIRCVVIGNRIVGAYKRVSKDGDFRANLALGGVIKKVDLSNEEKKVALEAAGAIGLNIAGVDIIRSERGPIIIEINSALDFVGHNIEQVSESGIAGAMIDFAVKGKEAFDRGEGGWLRDDPRPYATSARAASE
jgi:ribosomal protein S6--L-glutamate ligase